MSSNGIEFGMCWPEYSIILKKLFNSNKDKIFRLLKKLKEYNCSEIEFVNSDFLGIYHNQPKNTTTSKRSVGRE